MKGLVLQNNTCLINKTQFTTEVLLGGSSEHDVPKTRGLKPTKDSLKWTVATQADGTKGYTIWHIKVSNSSRMDEEVIESYKKRRNINLSVFWYVFCSILVYWGDWFFFLAFVCLLGLFDCLLMGGCNKKERAYGGTRRRIELGSMIWNPQRINNVFKKWKSQLLHVVPVFKILPQFEGVCEYWILLLKAYVSLLIFEPWQF